MTTPFPRGGAGSTEVGTSVIALPVTFACQHVFKILYKPLKKTITVHTGSSRLGTVLSVGVYTFATVLVPRSTTSRAS